MNGLPTSVLFLLCLPKIARMEPLGAAALLNFMGRGMRERQERDYRYESM